ncbi:MAG: hypothetical protein MUD10_04150 [Candidatus Pacebacteria bacterium]|nr:hypothetical protein [Candidatus Paceibacterota bacterium]
MAIFGTVYVLFNYGTFTPDFNYTTGGADLGEAIVGGIGCSLIPALVWGIAFGTKMGTCYGMLAGGLILAETILLHYSWNKIIVRPSPF